MPTTPANPIEWAHRTSGKPKGSVLIHWPIPECSSHFRNSMRSSRNDKQLHKSPKERTTRYKKPSSSKPSAPGCAAGPGDEIQGVVLDRFIKLHRILPGRQLASRLKR